MSQYSSQHHEIPVFNEITLFLFFLTAVFSVLSVDILQEEAQCLIGRNLQIDVAAKILRKFKRPHIILSTITEPYCTHWYLRGTATGTGNARSGDGVVTVQRIAGTDDHLTGHLLTDSSLLSQHLGRDMKQILLHLIGVGHYPTLEILRSTGTEIIASAMRPPVQLSAVPKVSL